MLSRDQLLDLTRGREGDVLDRSIDVLVSRLRRKLGDGAAAQLFKTVRNGGYQLAAKVECRTARREHVARQDRRAAGVVIAVVVGSSW